jgi:ribosomal protein L40E
VLTDAHLSRLCSSVQELDHDMQNRETQLMEIKKENYPAQQLLPAQTADYTPPTPTYTPPAAPAPGAYQPPAAPTPQVQAAICPSCGNPVRPNALYCRNCGAKLR